VVTPSARFCNVNTYTFCDTGTLPGEWGYLTGLKWLTLNTNNLTGMPRWCRLCSTATTMNDEQTHSQVELLHCLSCVYFENNDWSRGAPEPTFQLSSM
jgi:hypothetical protein